MAETYSRAGSVSLKKQTDSNAVIPDTFIPINDEDIATGFDYTPSIPISGNRSVNQRAIKNTIKAPTGNLNINVEPKTFGHILNGITGGLTSGNFIDISSVTGTFQTGETITGGTSTETATVDFVGDDFLIISSVSGTLTDGETLTGGTSSATATLGTYDSTVYGHAKTMPGDSTVTYSLQLNYSDRAFRYYGVRFHGIDSFAQSDNIITGGCQVMAQGLLRHAKVTAAVTSGAGAKSIPVDQVGGFVASDTIKVYRPSTGEFLDFSAASTKTHTIGTVDSANKELDITDLETSLAVGDLIVLAPQTPTYSIVDEYAWVGCSQMSIGADKDNLSTFDAQDFTMVLTNEFEERHAARGTNFEDRFPSDLLQKGLTGSGSFTLHNENEDFFRHYRDNTDQSIKLVTESDQIGSTGVNYKLEVLYSKIQFDNYDTNLSADDIVNEEVPFTSMYDDTAGYEVQVLLVNDIASY